MLLYKNGRIYEMKKQIGETRHEFMKRCWFLINADATPAEALAWAARESKGCSYGSLDEELIEAAKKFTK